MSGKGSTRRPAAVDEQTVEQNWERTFRLRECTPIPLYPQDPAQGDPAIAPDWYAKGL